MKNFINLRNMYKVTFLSVIFSILPMQLFATPSLEIMTENYPPFNFLDEKKQFNGIAVDLLEEMLITMGSDVRRDSFKIYPWARAYNNALSPGMQNMLFSTTRTPGREKLFKWVGPIAQNNVAVFGLSSRKISIQSDQDLPFFQFSVIRDDVAETHLLEKGVPDKHITRANNAEIMLQLLQHGRVELFVYGNNVAKWTIKQYGYNVDDFSELYLLDSSELYYAFNISVDDKVVAKYQKALDKVKENKDFMKQLNEKYT